MKRKRPVRDRALNATDVNRRRRGLEDPKLASVISEPFDVVPWEAYPGRPAAGKLMPPL